MYALSDVSSDMGFYIPGPARNKVEYLFMEHKARLIDLHDGFKFSDIKEHLALIVVVDNGGFEAVWVCVQ